MSQGGTYIKNAASMFVTEIAGNVGGNVAPNASGVINFLSFNSGYVEGDPPSNTLNIIGTPNYLVDVNGHAPYSLIGDAYTAAIGAGASDSQPLIIAIRNGTYAENLNITSPGVIFVSWDSLSPENSVAINSTLRVPQVRLTGAHTISANVKFIGIGFLPQSTNNIFTTAGTPQVRMVNCKAEPNNAPFFHSTNGGSFIIQNSAISSATTSTTDKLFTGSGGGGVQFYLNNTQIQLNAQSTGIAANIYGYYTQLITGFDFTAASQLSYFEMHHCDCDSGTTFPFITEPATQSIQFLGYDSRLNSGPTSGIKFVTGGDGSSYFKTYNCSIWGIIDLTNSSTIELVNSPNYILSTRTWSSFNSSNTETVNQTIRQTGSLSASQQILSTAGGADSYTSWSVLSTQGYSQGIDNSDSDKLKLTRTNAPTIDPSSGTTIWTLDPSNNVTTYSQPLISAGGTPVTVTSTTPYGALATDCFIAMDSSGGAKTIQLPNAPPVGTKYIVWDSSGSAATHNILVTTPSTVIPFNGIFNDTINQNYAQRSYTYVSGLLGYAVG